MKSQAKQSPLHPRNLRATFRAAFAPLVSWLPMLVILISSSGCDRFKTVAETSETPQQSAFSLEKFPMMRKMRLAVMPCRVLPKTSITINSPSSGQLRLYIDKAQTNLPAGLIWAEFEPKLLQSESNALADAKLRLEEKQKLLLELEFPKQTLKLAREIEDAKRQASLLELLSTNLTLAAAAAGPLNLKDRIMSAESLSRAKQELKVMEENYKYLLETNFTALGVDIQAQRLELEKRDLEFERQQTQARFKMPFAGQLNLSLQLAEGVSDYPVSAGQELAIARDVSMILLRVVLSDATWSGLAPEELVAVINLPDGQRLEAPFSLKKLEKVQYREDVVYYFQFPAEKIRSASRLMGTDVSCEIWTSLPEMARIVPKLALVLAQPSYFSNRRWNEGLARISHGSRVLIEGQTELAVVGGQP
ncbi:MAG TPA: hypothetical protein VGE41_05735 [Verrucomicrobiae bacterium]